MGDLKETKLPTYDGVGLFDSQGVVFYGISAPIAEHVNIRLANNVMKIENDLLFVHIVTVSNDDMTSTINELKFLSFNIPDFDPRIETYRVFNWHDLQPVTTREQAKLIIERCKPGTIKATILGEGIAPPEKCGNGVLTRM